MRDPTRLFVINAHACQGEREQANVGRGCFCASYLEGESVLAGAEPHVLHGGAADHHLSHISAGHKHWSAEMKRRSFVCFDSAQIKTQRAQSLHCANALQSCRLLLRRARGGCF